MAKQGKAHIVVSIPRLVTAAVLVGFLVGGTQLLPQPSQAQPLHPQTTASKNPVPYTAAPQTASQPVPTPAAPASPAVTKPVVKVHATHAVKSAPVVKPAPNASVASLKPVNPISTPPTSSGTGSSSGGNSPAPPLTTTAYTSSNWSGYFAAADTYTGVSGSWTVPTVTGIARHSSSDATWIGIGGVTSSDLIQVGTEDTVSRSGIQTSTAFYELLPNASIPITSLQVSPGDVMTANIVEVSSGQWTITIANTTKAKTYTKSVAYDSSYSSAEWIEEDPSFVGGTLVPFDNFRTVTFTGSTATTASGTLSLTDSNAQPITMLNSAGPVASPSAIGGDDKSFTVTHD